MLDYDISEYGDIPKDFIVSDTNFSPSYWVNKLYGEFYYPCKKYREEVCNSLIYSNNR